MKKKLTKLILLFLVIFAIMAAGITATASTVARYATQTIALKDKPTGKQVYKVKRNTKLPVIKEGKTWNRVRYNNQELYAKKRYLNSKKAVKKYSARHMRRSGRLRWRGYSFTWYSQRVLPGRGLKIPGRHVDKNGFVCDKYDYIVVASSRSNKRKKVIIATPFGKYGKCYDCGYIGKNGFDLYVNW